MARRTCLAVSYHGDGKSARARLSSKGQLVLPKSVRDARGWGAGTELEFVDDGADLIVRLAGKPDPRFAGIGWDEFEKRRIRHKGPSVSIGDMNGAVMEEAKRRCNEESH